MGKVSQHMAWGHLAWATIFFGVLTVVLIGGAQEVTQNNGPAWGATLATAGAAASAGVLAFLYWLNWRAAKRRAGIGVHPVGKRRQGGFWRWFIITLVALVVVRVAVFFLAAASGPSGPIANLNAIFVIAPGALIYTGLPLLAGIVGHLIRSTAPRPAAAAPHVDRGYVPDGDTQVKLFQIRKNAERLEIERRSRMNETMDTHERLMRELRERQSTPPGPD